jgi:hypothetical protein
MKILIPGTSGINETQFGLQAKTNASLSTLGFPRLTSKSKFNSKNYLFLQNVTATFFDFSANPLLTQPIYFYSHIESSVKTASAERSMMMRFQNSSIAY